MQLLNNLVFLTQIWFVSTCNNTVYSRIVQSCNDPGHQINFATFNSLQICYPWIKETFPNCWFSYYRLIKAYNNSKFGLDDVCQQQCNEVNEACSMFNSGVFVSDSHCFGKLQNRCKQMDKTQCKQEKLPKSNERHCDGELVDSEEEYYWTLHWNIQKKDANITIGCSRKCDSDLNIFRTGQHQVDGPIIALFVFGILACLFTVLSFLIDWKAQNRYPAIILFILNVCFMMSLLGWMIQYIGLGSRISCNSRKERRYKEPLSSDSIWCIISFILIYFFSIAIACWFVILNYAWFISFRTMSSIKIIIQDKVKFFHSISWSISSVLTIMALCMGEIDAHSITNICFLMTRDRSVHNWLVSAPFTVSILLGECLLVQCVRQLQKLRMDCSMFLIPKAVNNITRTMYRLVIYGSCIGCAFSILAFTIYRQDEKSERWNEENAKFVSCMIERSSFNLSHICIPPNNSTLLNLQLQVVAIFIMCIMTSSWTWTRGTMRIWKKVWKKRFMEDQMQAKVRAQINWYHRMNQKKISPFLPPVNLDNPFDENNFNFIRHNSKRFSLPEELLHKKEQTDSKDIRSVVQLFSKRRNTFGSLHSVHSSDFENCLRSDKRTSIQSFGHISVAPLKRTPSNLTVVQIHHHDNNTRHNNKRDTTLTSDDIRQIRDKLYTPLTTVHKDNIVADCVPYNRNDVEKSLVSSVIELRKNLRNDRESIDVHLNMSNTRL